MINYETILSTADNKLTLMKWLQKVEDALKNASLESVTASQPTTTTLVLTFHFADGTTLETPSIVLPRGLTGETGPQGPTGEQGVGITNIEITSGEVFVTLSNGNVIDAGYIGEGVPDAQYDFLDEEYKKTLNLFAIEDKYHNGNYSYTGDQITFYQGGQRFFIHNQEGWKPNTQYTISFVKVSGRCALQVIYTDTTSTAFEHSPFVTDPNKTISQIRSSNYDGEESVLSNLMLNEGNSALPYARYHGKVLHSIDVKGVTLWVNGSPTSSQAPVTLQLGDLSDYEYLVIFAKLEKGTAQSEQSFKIATPKDIAKYAYLGLIDSNSSDLYHRSILINPSGACDIGRGNKSGTELADACIVTAIYGIK